MMPLNCNFCGLCCTLAVKVSEKDVRKIEKGTGADRKDFTRKSVSGDTLLKKKKDGWCTFFELKKGVGRCKIYDSRPSICRDFPAKRVCDLSSNVVFRLSKNLSPNVKMLLKKAPKKEDPLPEETPKFPF